MKHYMREEPWNEIRYLIKQWANWHLDRKFDRGLNIMLQESTANDLTKQLNYLFK